MTPLSYRLRFMRKLLLRLRFPLPIHAVRSSCLSIPSDVRLSVLRLCPHALPSVLLAEKTYPLPVLIDCRSACCQHLLEQPIISVFRRRFLFSSVSFFGELDVQLLNFFCPFRLLAVQRFVVRAFTFPILTVKSASCTRWLPLRIFMALP